MWARRGADVLVIRLAKTANAADIGQALLPGGEAATHFAAAFAVVRAPRIGLGVGARADCKRSEADCQYEQQRSHSARLLVLARPPVHDLFGPSVTRGSELRDGRKLAAALADPALRTSSRPKYSRLLVDEFRLRHDFRRRVHQLIGDRIGICAARR